MYSTKTPRVIYLNLNRILIQGN